MSADLDMSGCRIEIRKWYAAYLDLCLKFVETEETSVVSPNFDIGVINFQFRVERRPTGCFTLFVRFDKKRVHDKLNYAITYKHWTDEKMKFDTTDTWHFVCSNGYVNGSVMICVEVDLSTLPSPYASLYTDTELTDFKLIGNDGDASLHKAIAASYSPFFKEKFAGTWKETAEGVIEVPGISQITLQHLKEYMYLGTLPKTDVTQLLLLSKFCMMEELEDRCLYILRTTLSKDNVFELMEFAVANKQTRLLYEVLDVTQQSELSINRIEKFQKYL